MNDTNMTILCFADMKRQRTISVFQVRRHLPQQKRVDKKWMIRKICHSDSNRAIMKITADIAWSKTQLPAVLCLTEQHKKDHALRWTLKITCRTIDRFQNVSIAVYLHHYQTPQMLLSQWQMPVHLISRAVLVPPSYVFIFQSSIRLC